MRTNRPQYINKPPSYPVFLFKRSHLPLVELIKWAKKEHDDWLKYLTSRNYLKQLWYFNNNVPPYRILAEMSGFRRIVADINIEIWNRLTRQERDFVIKAFEMRDIILR